MDDSSKHLATTRNISKRIKRGANRIPQLDSRNRLLESRQPAPPPPQKKRERKNKRRLRPGTPLGVNEPPARTNHRSLHSTGQIARKQRNRAAIGGPYLKREPIRGSVWSVPPAEPGGERNPPGRWRRNPAVGTMKRSPAVRRKLRGRGREETQPPPRPRRCRSLSLSRFCKQTSGICFCPCEEGKEGERGGRGREGDGVFITARGAGGRARTRAGRRTGSGEAGGGVRDTEEVGLTALWPACAPGFGSLSPLLRDDDQRGASCHAMPCHCQDNKKFLSECVFFFASFGAVSGSQTGPRVSGTRRRGALS
jgi:hypothetical protein